MTRRKRGPQQTTLFNKWQTATPGPALPAGQPVATSIAAAERVAPHAGTMRERVFAYVKQTGTRGATRAEIADALGMRLQTVCGRCSELLGNSDKGLPSRIYQTSEARDGGKVLRVRQEGGR